MAKRTGGEMEVGVRLGSTDSHVASSTPFHIAILGDFSGRENRSVIETGSELAARKIHQVDRDNLDEVIAQIKPRLDHVLTASDGQSISLAFDELEDFDPDQLFDQVPLFASLKQTRNRLYNEQTFDAAAAEVRAWAGPVDSPPSSPPTEPSTAEPIDTDNLFDQVLGETAPANSPGVDWQSMVHDIVAPFVTPEATPGQAELVACVDAAVSKSMATLLHHPDFQQLESNWRGVDLLTRRLETDSSLKIFLIDVSKEELFADRSATDDIAETGLYRFIVERTVGTPGQTPWSVLIGAFEFDDNENDVSLLEHFASVANAAGAPLITSPKGNLFGFVSPDSTPEADDWSSEPSAQWKSLQQHADAGHLGLIWPRFLLRLPYGRRTSRIERFDFEEFAGLPNHDEYLWGHPAFLPALLLGEAFTLSRGEFRLAEAQEVSGLPMHLYEREGETEIHPCGELLLTERSVQPLIEHGIMPLLSVRNQDVVRLAQFRALNGAPLAGRWS